MASTGSITDYHEIDNAVVTTLNPVPTARRLADQLRGGDAVAGQPGHLHGRGQFLGGGGELAGDGDRNPAERRAPGGRVGPGWVCGAPIGQQISCTNSTSPFTSGTITVNGVVNSSSVTPALIQSSTTAVASSADASPATSSSAPPGTVPAAPNVTGISPTNGAAGGGNDVTVTGTNLGGATAIEIGTAAEFAAGTPTTLNLCSSAAPGCFTVTSATSLDISSMPAHTAASVQVSVVSLGIAGTGAYTLQRGPRPAVPRAAGR